MIAIPNWITMTYHKFHYSYSYSSTKNAAPNTQLRHLTRLQHRSAKSTSATALQKCCSSKRCNPATSTRKHQIATPQLIVNRFIISFWNSLLSVTTFPYSKGVFLWNCHPLFQTSILVRTVISGRKQKESDILNLLGSLQTERILL